ncbi:MAG: hypothetical protein JNJ58_02810 [Chitinophagaceae bacterium]|nr:hypothetical protein [Chitinophagaceae bacterium]
MVLNATRNKLWIGLFVMLFSFQGIQAQNYQVLTTNNSNNSNGITPQGQMRWTRSVFLITAYELYLANITGSTNFNYLRLKLSTAAAIPASGNVKVYMQNTQDGSNLKSTQWATAIAPMTLVSNGPFTFPSTTGNYQISFNTSVFSYTGGGIYVAIEYSNPAGTVSTTTSHAVTTATAGLAMRTQSTSATAPSTLNAANERPDIQLGYQYTNDLQVAEIYTYGILPRTATNAHVIRAVVKNVGSTTTAATNVTLSISGANTFNPASQSVPSLAPGASITVNFPAYTPTSNGNCQVTVSVPADNNNSNNSITKSQIVSPNIMTYKIPGENYNAGIGLTGTTFEIVSKFTLSSAASVRYVMLDFASLSASATYKITIYGDNGSGMPGTQLYIDPTNRNLFNNGDTLILSTPVAVSAGNIFVGVMQTGANSINLGGNIENPIRPGNFYYRTPITGLFSDCAALGQIIKPNIGIDLLLPCVGTPAPGNTLAYNSFICNGSSVPLWPENQAMGTGLTYQWYSSSNGTNWSAIPNANNSTYLSSGITANTYYYTQVTCTSSGGTGNSAPIMLTNLLATQAGTATGVALAVTYTPVTYNVTGYAGALNWQVSSNNITFTDIPGATNPTLQYSFTGADTFFVRCKSIGSGCNTEYSNVVSTIVTIPNDNICDAFPLAMGANPGPYTNAGATTQPGEPTPPLNLVSNTTQNSWTSAPSHSVWFSFVAPASGKIAITMNPANWDSELALWSASSCISLSTGGGTMLAANEDMYPGNFPFAAKIEPICVVPGQTYYIQLDGNGMGQSTGFGLNIIDQGSLSISGLSSVYAYNTAPVTMTGIPSGGVFSGPGVSGNVFTPSAAGPGLHTITYTLAGYCSPATFIVEVLPGNVTLNLTAFIQGYYRDYNDLMTEVLFNQGVEPNLTLNCDSVLVTLHDPVTLAPVYSFSGILLVDGSCVCSFPTAANGNSYYISLKNRSAVETWSAMPVLMSSLTNYNFSTSATQAYGGNQIQIDSSPIRWGIYSGDIDQSGGIDGDDFNIMDPDIQSGNGGYLSSDIDGSGGVDGDDFNIFDPNSQGGIGAFFP